MLEMPLFIRFACLECELLRLIKVHVDEKGGSHKTRSMVVIAMTGPANYPIASLTPAHMQLRGMKYRCVGINFSHAIFFFPHFFVHSIRQICCVIIRSPCKSPWHNGGHEKRQHNPILCGLSTAKGQMQSSLSVCALSKI